MKLLEKAHAYYIDISFFYQRHRYIFWIKSIPNLKNQ